VSDVEAIERATLAAVTPVEVFEGRGWLAGLENGSIRRARSAVPLRHDLAADRHTLDTVERAYTSRDLTPAFRIADVAGLGEVRAALSARRFVPEQPTLVMAAPVAAAGQAEPGEILAAPDEAWRAVFVGEGFDAADGAYRVAALSRCRNAVFGQVQEDGVTVAVGVAAFGHGWASVHGMRTAKSHRGRGLARRVMTAFSREAAHRGLDRVFLQVEEDNASARALYARTGFETAWRYHYWSRL
jgi:ribosomal protein S18 acetylase RimI-like enzyme